MNYPPKTTGTKSNLPAFVNAEKWTLFFSLAVVSIVNLQVLFTFFYADDFLHFYQIANWTPLEFIFSSIGGHPYIFRNFIFYVMFKLFGVNSVAFFSVVLMTHLGCALLLYKIIYLLTGKTFLASAGMLIWGISPAHYPLLTWYSAYGHMLAGLFFLLFLYDLFRIEKEKISFSMNMAVRWSFYIFLMGNSYGIGLVVACLTPAAIVILLWQKNEKWKIASSMLPITALLILLFIFKNDIYYYFSGIIPDSKAALMRVPLSAAWSNFKCILELFAGQCALNIYCAATFPFFLISLATTTSLAPLTAIHFFNFHYILIPVAAAIPATIIFFLIFSRSNQSRSYYIVLMIIFLVIMGLLAYEHGAKGKSPIIPVVAVLIMTRFYYISLMIIAMILTLMADELLNINPKMSQAASLCVFIVIAISIYPSITFAHRINFQNHAVKDKTTYHNTIAYIEKTIQAHPEGSSVFIDNAMNEKISLYPTLQTDFPGKAAIFTLTYPSNTVKKRRVYFVEQNCLLADEHIKKKNWRTSSLIVSACVQNRKATE